MWKGVLFLQPKNQTYSWSWHGWHLSRLSPSSAVWSGLSGSCASSSALHTWSLCVCSSHKAAKPSGWVPCTGCTQPLAEAVFLGGSCRILRGTGGQAAIFWSITKRTHRVGLLVGPVKQVVCEMALPFSSGDGCVMLVWMWLVLTLSENLSAA